MPQIGEHKTKDGVTGEWTGTTWRRVDVSAPSTASDRRVGERKTRDGIVGEWDGQTWRRVGTLDPESRSMVGTALDTARNVGVGALKGAGQTVTNLGELVHKIPGVTTAVDALYGRPGLSARAFSQAERVLAPSNAAQTVGAIGEQIGEVALSGAPRLAAAGVSRLPGVARLAQKAVLRLIPAVARDAIVAGGSAALHDQPVATGAILGGALPLVAAGGSRGAAMLGAAGQKVAASPVLQRRIADVVAPSVGLGIGGVPGAAIGYATRRAIRSATVPIVRTGAHVAARTMPAVSSALDAVVDAGRAVPVRGARPSVAVTPIPSAARSAAGAVPEAAEQLPLLDARMIDRGRPLEAAGAPSSIHEQLVEALMDREAKRGATVLPKMTKADVERITALDRQFGSEDAARAFRHDPRFRGMNASDRTAAIKAISQEQAGTLPERARVVFDNIWTDLKTRQDQIAYLADQRNPAVKLYLSGKPLKTR